MHLNMSMLKKEDYIDFKMLKDNNEIDYKETTDNNNETVIECTFNKIENNKEILNDGNKNYPESEISIIIKLF